MTTSPPSPETVAALVVQGRIAKRAKAIAVLLFATVLSSLSISLDALAFRQLTYFTAVSFAVFIIALPVAWMLVTTRNDERDFDAALRLLAQAEQAIEAAGTHDVEALA